MNEDLFGFAVVEEVRISWAELWLWALRDRLRRERESAWLWLARHAPHALCRWVLVHMTVSTMHGDEPPDAMTYPVIAERWEKQREERHGGTRRS